MSDVNDTLAETQALDLKARCQAESYFSDVAVIVRDDNTVADAEAMALGFMTVTGGKIGACLIIEQPEYVDQMNGVQDGPMRMNWRVLCLENRVINADTANGGTGKRALALARHFRRLIRNYHAGGLTQQFIFDRISRVKDAVYYDEARDESTSLVCWSCEFHGSEADFVNVAKVNRPVLSPNSGAVPQTVTITCTTADVTIYYTTDGTHPWSGNSAAQVYSGALTISTACVLRACAFKTNHTASDVAAGNYT